MPETTAFEDYEILLKEFQKLPVTERTYPTAMEIAGYDHYEQFFTRFLSFFLNTTEVHGLKDLVIKSVMDCIPLSSEEIPENAINTRFVDTETYTRNGKFIDIFAETDQFFLAIENKIFAGLNNPLSAYSEFLEEQNTDQKAIYRIILSIKPLNHPEITANGFVNILYSDLITNLQSRLGHYISEGNARYLTLLSEFIETIKKHSNNRTMDTDKIDFFNKYYETAERLVEDYQDILNQIHKEKVKGVQELISSERQNLKNQWIFKRNTLVHDFDLNGKVIAIDTHFTVRGVQCTVFNRGQNANLVKDLKIYDNAVGTHNNRLIAIEGSKLPITTPNEQIAEQIENVLAQIAYK